jgi:hypothetical protein
LLKSKLRPHSLSVSKSWSVLPSKYV